MISTAELKYKTNRLIRNKSFVGSKACFLCYVDCAVLHPNSVLLTLIVGGWNLKFTHALFDLFLVVRLLWWVWWTILTMRMKMKKMRKKSNL